MFPYNPFPFTAFKNSVKNALLMSANDSPQSEPFHWAPPTELSSPPAVSAADAKWDQQCCQRCGGSLCCRRMWRSSPCKWANSWIWRCAATRMGVVALLEGKWKFEPGKWCINAVSCFEMSCCLFHLRCVAFILAGWFVMYVWWCACLFHLFCVAFIHFGWLVAL